MTNVSRSRRYKPQDLRLTLRRFPVRTLIFFAAILLSACGSVPQCARPLNRSVENSRPIYPEESRKRDEEGTVILKALVRKDGTACPVLVHESSGFERLDKAALAAVEQWTFMPAKKDGNPVDEWYFIPIPFKLTPQGTSK